MISRPRLELENTGMEELGKKKLEQMAAEKHITDYFLHWEQLNKHLVKYKKGEMIALYGEITNKIFFLLSGSIRFTSINEDYEEFFFFDAVNEGLFGEVEYVLDIPSITQSEVMDDCYCIIIPTDVNKSLLDNDIKFQREIARVLARKYNDQRALSVDTETYSVDVRLAHYILYTNLSDELQDLTTIAKTLKCSYRQLLRVLNTFCQQKWLRHGFTKGTYFVINREDLKNHYIEKNIISGGAE